MSQKNGRPTRRTPLQNSPFYHSGIDMFGPFNIRHGKATRASPGVQKAWVLIFSCLYSRAVHLETLDSIDTSSFKLAFHRFQSLRGECTYLRSDAGSNFVGARNEEMSRESQELDKVVREMQDHWQHQGKQWDMNPPLASHFGGVWERAIGQVKQIIQGYLLPRQDRLLSKEEFHTMLFQASRIVNSTPLHVAPESPNDSQPTTPHHLLTQRDDSCLEAFSRPTNYNEADLLAYGANRWNRHHAPAPITRAGGPPPLQHPAMQGRLHSVSWQPVPCAIAGCIAPPAQCGRGDLTLFSTPLRGVSSPTAPINNNPHSGVHRASCPVRAGGPNSLLHPTPWGVQLNSPHQQHPA